MSKIHKHKGTTARGESPYTKSGKDGSSIQVFATSKREAKKKMWSFNKNY